MREIIDRFFFFKFKFLRGYDDILSNFFIIYYFFSILNINNYKKKLLYINRIVRIIRFHSREILNK